MPQRVEHIVPQTEQERQWFHCLHRCNSSPSSLLRPPLHLAGCREEPPQHSTVLREECAKGEVWWEEEHIPSVHRRWRQKVWQGLRASVGEKGLDVLCLFPPLLM